MTNSTPTKQTTHESKPAAPGVLLAKIESTTTIDELQSIVTLELQNLLDATAVIFLAYGPATTAIQLISLGLSPGNQHKLTYPLLNKAKKTFKKPLLKSGFVHSGLMEIAQLIKTSNPEIFLLEAQGDYLGEVVIFGKKLTEIESKTVSQIIRQTSLMVRIIDLTRIVANESEAAQAFRRVTQAITRSLDFDAVSDTLLGNTRDLFKVDAVALALLDPVSNNYKLDRMIGLSKSFIKNASIPANHPTMIEITKSHHPIQFLDAKASPIDCNDYVVKESEALSSVLLAPIFSGDDLVGVLGLFTKSMRTFHASEVLLCQSLAEQAGIALANANLHNDLRKISHEIEQTRNFMQDGLLVLSLKHELMYFNDAAGLLLDLNEAALGKLLTTSLLDASAQFSLTDEQLTAAISSAMIGKSERTSFSVSTEHEIEYFEAVYSPYYDGMKKPIGVLVSIRDITQLYLEKEKLASIQANLQDGLVVLDAQGIVIECNDEWMKLFDMKESFIGKQMFEQMIKSTNLSFDRSITVLIKEVLSGKRMTCYGVNTITNRHFQISFGPILLANQVTGAIATSRDITPLIDKTIEANEMATKAQTHLRELSQLAELSSIVGFNLENIYEKYISKTLTLISSNHVRVYLYEPSRKALVLQKSNATANNKARNSYELGGDELISRAFTERRSVVESKEGLNEEKLALPIVHHSKILGVISIERTNKPYNEHDGKLLRLVATRLAILIENASLYHDVNSRRERWEAVFRFTEEGIVIFDKNGLIVGFNPATVDMTHWGTSEAIGQPFGKVIKTIGNESINLGPTPLARVLGEGITIAKSEQLIESRSGERLWTEISYSPIFDDAGRVTSGIAVIHNTQKDKEIEEIKSDFISIVSHELRTPLTAIKGFLSMILKQDFGELNEKQFHYLSRVYQSNQRMIDLVEDLLNATYIESGKIALSINPVAVESVMAEVVSELAGKAASSQVMVKVKRRQKLPLVLADETRLHQIILNLVDNAIKYSMPGTEVEIEFSVQSDELITSVSDHGVGVTKSQIDRLFTKFGRVYNPMSAQAGGTGLGLYIVKNLVESHGGRIWVTSQEGKGSKFRFSIPIAKQLPLLG
jgi:PAS domain S-box-containing protein